MCFKVYYDGGTGAIDYENALATITYVGRRFYEYRSGELEDGRYLFAIRAEDAGGVENGSWATLMIEIGTCSPDGVDILSTETV